MKTIDSFQGNYRWLSNFWPAQVQLDGVTYPSVEHAYQAAKMRPSERAPFLHGTAGQAKRAGRNGRIRSDWEQAKVPTMRALLYCKFAPGTDLAGLLAATGDADLIEGNTWGDTFWGVCRGRGENQLGRLLMEVRSALALV